MFGQLKENIYYNIQKQKDNAEEAAKQFGKYFSTLKESKELKVLHNLYAMVESAHFENETIAIQFLDESIKEYMHFRDQNLRGKASDLPKLQEMAAAAVQAQVSERVKALDNLLFNENLNVKEKFDQKIILIKDLTKSREKKVNREEMLSNLGKKVNDQVTKLTVEQKEALEVFLERDEKKIHDYFNNLIETTINSIDNHLVKEEKVEVVTQMVATRRKLQELKNQSPEIGIVELVLDLKQGLDA